MHPDHKTQDYKKNTHIAHKFIPNQHEVKNSLRSFASEQTQTGTGEKNSSYNKTGYSGHELYK